MRRTLHAIALLCLVATLASFEIGRRAEREYRAALAGLSGPLPFELVAEDYERGWFRSRAVTVLRGRAPAAPGDTALRLRLHHEIEHGPYPLGYVLSRDFDGWPVAVRARTLATLEAVGAGETEVLALPFGVEGLFTRAGDARLRIVPDPAHAGALAPDAAATLRIAGDGSSLSGRLEVPRAELESEAGSFVLRGLAWELDYRRAPEAGSLYAGESRLRVGLLRVAPGTAGFELRELALSVASGVSAAGWSLEARGSLGRFHGDEREIGPGELELRVTGLAPGPLAELVALGRHLGGGATSIDFGTEAVGAHELSGALAALWPRLMALGPTFEIPRLRLETAQGELRMALRLGVDPADPAALAEPWGTVFALALDAELALPEALLHLWLATPRPVADGAGDEAALWVAPAELASRRVATWLDRGYLERHEGRYLLTVRVRKGSVRLNGRLVPPEAL